VGVYLGEGGVGESAYARVAAHSQEGFAGQVLPGDLGVLGERMVRWEHRHEPVVYQRALLQLV
jgi:hypothetical protein